MQRREMIVEYFSMAITEDGMVETLPSLLPGYSPNLDKLPLFLMRLGPQVNWTSGNHSRIPHGLSLALTNPST